MVKHTDINRWNEAAKALGDDVQGPEQIQGFQSFQYTQAGKVVAVWNGADGTGHVDAVNETRAVDEATSPPAPVTTVGPNGEIIPNATPTETYAGDTIPPANDVRPIPELRDEHVFPRIPENNAAPGALAADAVAAVETVDQRPAVELVPSTDSTAASPGKPAFPDAGPVQLNQTNEGGKADSALSGKTGKTGKA